MLSALLKTTVAVVGALWLAVAGWSAAQWWERRPAGQPQLRLWVFRWSPSDSLAAQRDRALAAVSNCRGAIQALESGIARQNAAIETLRTQSDRRIATARSALAGHRAESKRARSTAAALSATPLAGQDACLRMEAADRRILETLR